MSYIFSKLYIILLFTAGAALSQPKTNLEIFNQLVDSSANTIISSLPPNTKEISLSLNLTDKYSVFYNRIGSSFTQRNIKLNNGNNDSLLNVNFQLENAFVEYGEIYRNGFFGSFLMPRKSIVSGNYSVSDRDIMINKFTYTYSDTIDADDLELIGTAGYPFTFAEPPEEPFFSSLFEPIAAVGTAAIAIILFFSVRSK